MNRPFLFLAGEYTVTMPLVFQRDAWSHTMSAKRLVATRIMVAPAVSREPRILLHREGVSESLEGVVWYADVEHEEIRRANLEMLAFKRIPCWPDPIRLRALDDRHHVMWECKDAGLTTDPVVFARKRGATRRPFLAAEIETALLEADVLFPMVVKTGNLHRGEGKYLLRQWDDIDALPPWEGLATIEPFYEGTSCRVLTLGDRVFGLRYDNPDTWIKNAAGAEVELWPEIPDAVKRHAARVHAHFGLEVSGIDYVVGPKGEPHFLEFNLYPGVGAFDEVQEAARVAFRGWMDRVERMAGNRCAR